MKAFVTTIGEKTTEIAIEQLERYGFEVIVLDGHEDWLTKYDRFIEAALSVGENCLRVDADVIVNSNIERIEATLNDEYMLMAQFKVYDLYQNNIQTGQPVWYSVEGLRTIKKHRGEFYDLSRPETSAWRLKQVNDRTYTADLIVGMHGFFQDDEHLNRAEYNKKKRRQGQYDFDLARRLKNL